jgi:Flp pilus assembly protein TadG
MPSVAKGRRRAPRGKLRCSSSHRCARADDGYSVVEASITLPVLILLTMLVVQWALVWHGRHVAEAAAQDGLRAARGYQATAGNGQNAAKNYVQAVAPRLLISPRVDVTRTATTVTVHVHASVLSVLPGSGFEVDGTAAAPVERFVP